jgi:hypothetical protein
MRSGLKKRKGGSHVAKASRYDLFVRLEIALCALAASVFACSGSGAVDGGADHDSTADVGAGDNGIHDHQDAMMLDDGGSSIDAAPDGASPDSAPGDGASDASVDSGSGDGGSSDGGSGDAGSGDTGSGDTGSGDGAPNPDAAGTDATLLADLSDEFNDPATLSNWTILNVLEGTPPAYTTLDIGTSTAGQLTIIPTESFWFDDAEGTLVFKLVTGDFVMHTSVSATNINDSTMPPFQQYNGGGLMARDPASHSGGRVQNWLIITTGFQDQTVGTEDASTTASNSSLNLRPGGFKFELVICRLGSGFHIFSRVRGETFWQDVDDDVRPDLPQTLQVGMAAQAFGMPPDVRLEFEYVRFARPTMLSDCTADIPPH